MFYVYRLQSLAHQDWHYTGFTTDLRERVEAHSAGKITSSAVFRPWKLTFYAAFEEEQKAREFERYLKTGSGLAFGNQRLC